jgi:RNA polymerase sigma factor (sigma-70 family)
VPDVTTTEQFRAGNPDAVRDVYREYGRLVYAVAYKVLGNRSLAEEATQQTFLQAWRAASSFDAAKELGPWLATIARRAAIDVHRRESRRVTQPLDDVAPTHPDIVTLPPSAEQAYDVWAVRQAIDGLPDEERQVVRLQHVDGLTQTEVAAQLGVPLGTVKSRSFRAHRRLAGQLGYLREEQV